MADSWNFEQAVEQGTVALKKYDDYIEHGKGCLANWFSEQNIETNICEDRIVDPIFDKTEVELHFQCSPQEHQKLSANMANIFTIPQ